MKWTGPTLRDERYRSIKETLKTSQNPTLVSIQELLPRLRSQNTPVTNRAAVAGSSACERRSRNRGTVTTALPRRRYFPSSVKIRFQRDEIANSWDTRRIRRPEPFACHHNRHIAHPNSEPYAPIPKIALYLFWLESPVETVKSHF